MIHRFTQYTSIENVLCLDAYTYIRIYMHAPLFENVLYQMDTALLQYSRVVLLSEYQFKLRALNIDISHMRGICSIEAHESRTSSIVAENWRKKVNGCVDTLNHPPGN